MATENDDAKIEEINTFMDELGEWVRSRTPEHEVSVPFALARILCEVVSHDGGTLGDIIALVEAAAKKGVRDGRGPLN
jgi:hypothetical protein